MPKAWIVVPDDAWGLSIKELRDFANRCNKRFWVTNRISEYQPHLGKFKTVGLGQFRICSNSKNAIGEAVDHIRRAIREKGLDIQGHISIYSK